MLLLGLWRIIAPLKNLLIMLLTILLSSQQKVNVYTCELLTLGLVWHAFPDASKEGDGKWILKVFKCLMLIFKKSSYAKKTMTLMILVYERKAACLAAQIINSRFL
jgi:predicted neuraminidase